MATHELERDPKYDNYDYPTTSPNVQSGHPGHTTKEQDAQIFQLRAQLEQAGYTERLDTLTMVRIFCLRAGTSTVVLTVISSCGFYEHGNLMLRQQS